MGRFRYGSTQTPRSPAPELTLEVQAPTAEECKQKLTCIIDTGACVSCLPRKVLEKLPLKDYTIKPVSWASGQVTQTKMYAVNLVVGAAIFYDVFVLETDKTYGLIGRDLLNTHRLLCDGPNQVWNVEPEWA